MPFPISHAAFVEAFYTTPLFKLERLLLCVLLSRPSTDAQARLLAQGQLASFAAWSVESRAENQIVLATGRTRSWLMVATLSPPSSATRLYFGSAVVPPRSPSGAARGMGPIFTAVLGFHKLYSRALLWSAQARLASQSKGTHAQRGA